MQELEYQKDKLRKNLEELRERSRENALLSTVVKDYQRYEDRLRSKDEQLHIQGTAYEQHLQMLTAYIQDIMETNELTESGLNKLTHENTRIWDMIQKIKNRPS
jgi:FtsZ-binding cell division protein ZapB